MDLHFRPMAYPAPTSSQWVARRTRLRPDLVVGAVPVWGFWVLRGGVRSSRSPTGEANPSGGLAAWGGQATAGAAGTELRRWGMSSSAGSTRRRCQNPNPVMTSRTAAMMKLTMAPMRAIWPICQKA